MSINNYSANTIEFTGKVELVKTDFAIRKIEFKRISNLNIPEEWLLELPELESIWISNCELAQFPEFVFKIPQLKELCFIGTKLKSIPDRFNSITNLNVLSFAENQLESIPESLFSLTELEELHIANNPIKELSPMIAQLTKLKLLSINGTLIQNIPEEIIQLKSLWYFDIGETSTENMSTQFYSWLDAIKVLKRIDPIRKRDKYIMDTFGRNIITQPPSIDEKKLIVKQSTIPGAGEGVFADEDIPEGTIFMKDDGLARKINDLAWKHNETEYLTVENLKENINTVFVIECINPQIFLFFGHFTANYLKSIKPIKKGEELSRMYGLDYWKAFQSKK